MLNFLFERDLIRERTKAGLEAARSRGRKGGRPKGLSKEAENIAYAVKSLYRERKLSVQEIANRLESKATSYKYLKYWLVLKATERQRQNNQGL
ncbi:MAG: recombinase family protein, partial [Alphaproteobacteria bacterium]|nr:recombinase family protein [Alphaproteobacteria bacterium]